jgi:hypothetical protein
MMAAKRNVHASVFARPLAISAFDSNLSARLGAGGSIRLAEHFRRALG